MIVDSKKPYGSLYCSICRGTITERASIFQESLHFGIVCPNCHTNNSQEDLELMANLFLAFGGFFGKKKDIEFDVEIVLRNLIDEVHSSGSQVSVENLNVKVLHRALLHGVTPKQYIAKLETILEE
ncbi:MAG: hypothetical protein ACW986_03735 [Promethearchaeota archaeon]|jgi:hypothetical protein